MGRRKKMDESEFRLGDVVTHKKLDGEWVIVFLEIGLWSQGGLAEHADRLWTRLAHLSKVEDGLSIDWSAPQKRAHLDGFTVVRNLTDIAAKSKEHLDSLAKAGKPVLKRFRKQTLWTSLLGVMMALKDLDSNGMTHRIKVGADRLELIRFLGNWANCSSHGTLEEFMGDIGEIGETKRRSRK